MCRITSISPITHVAYIHQALVCLRYWAQIRHGAYFPPGISPAEHGMNHAMSEEVQGLFGAGEMFLPWPRWDTVREDSTSKHPAPQIGLPGDPMTIFRMHEHCVDG